MKAIGLKKFAIIGVFACALALMAAAMTGCSSGNFDKYGIKADMEVGKQYEFNATCKFDASQSTVGKAEVISKQTFESADGYPAKTDYEWQKLTMRVTLDDESAWSHGYLIEWVVSNYDDLTCCSNLTYDSTGKAEFIVTVTGQQFECTITKTTKEYGWASSGGHHERVLEVTWIAQVPKDYESMVFGVMDGAIANSSAYKAKSALNEYYSEDQFALFRYR